MMTYTYNFCNKNISTIYCLEKRLSKQDIFKKLYSCNFMCVYIKYFIKTLPIKISVQEIIEITFSLILCIFLNCFNILQ